MSEHTPGPWGVTAAMKTSAWGVCAPSGQIVKDIFQQTDAHLIAAAPDLLEAAEWLLSDDWNDGIGSWVTIQRRFEAVIAKAKGL